jgi:hypothetical protein
MQSFEQVDKLVNNADLSALKAAAKRGTTRGTRGPQAMAAPNVNVCEIYGVVRPILLLVAGTPFIPKKWKDVIKLFVQAMDGFCPQS